MYWTLLFSSHDIQEPCQQMQRCLWGQTGGQNHQPEKLSTWSVLQVVNWSKAAFQVFSQTGSPSRRKVVPVILRQQYSLQENCPEAVRQSPCSHEQPSRTNSAVFHFHVLYQHIVLLKMEKTNVKGLTSLGLLGVNQDTNELYLQVTITETSLQKTGGKEG